MALDVNSQREKILFQNSDICSPSSITQPLLIYKSAKAAVKHVFQVRTDS